MDDMVGYAFYIDRGISSKTLSPQKMDEWSASIHKERKSDFSDWNLSNRYFIDSLNWNKKSQNDTAKTISPQ